MKTRVWNIRNTESLADFIAASHCPLLYTLTDSLPTRYSRPGLSQLPLQRHFQQADNFTRQNSPPLELHTNYTHYVHSTQNNVQLQCVRGPVLGSLLGPVYFSLWSQVAGRVSSDSEGGNIAHAQWRLSSHTLSNCQVKEDAVQQCTAFKRCLKERNIVSFLYVYKAESYRCILYVHVFHNARSVACKWKVVTSSINAVTNKLLNAASKHITESRASVLWFYLITVSNP